MYLRVSYNYNIQKMITNTQENIQLFLKLLCLPNAKH